MLKLMHFVRNFWLEINNGNEKNDRKKQEYIAFPAGFRIVEWVWVCYNFFYEIRSVHMLKRVDDRLVPKAEMSVKDQVTMLRGCETVIRKAVIK